MRAGWNATRRNRNIGTCKQGYGQNNKMVIPTTSCPGSHSFFEKLQNYKSVRRQINGNTLTFLVEQTRHNCYYACTIEDIVHILQFVPTLELSGIKLIILRQPKIKEELLNPVWGRWFPYVAIGASTGAAIYLEAVDLSKPIRWRKSLSPSCRLELERLRNHGHVIITTQRYHVIKTSLDSVRHTQLYRTLLHEIGHHVDYSRNENSFREKPKSDKEAFAHRYADNLREELKARGVIPFERMVVAP